ncbi:MAG: AsmA-like C-terminal region-containing protein, partial [Methyloceanibacter sp.]
RLIDAQDGSIVAQAPLAAIGMSGSALLTGRLAPGSVDLIGPRLLLFYNDEQGLTLSFSRPAGGESGPVAAQAEEAVPPETAIASRPETPIGAGGRKLDLSSTVSEVFERARRGDSSYLNRFGFKDALVVLDRHGTQTLWHVPDFAIDLEHHNKRSILVGQANVASTKGDWQLELRTEQNTKRKSLGITALLQNLVPSGIAGNFPSIGALKALDMAVDGEATAELSSTGEFMAGKATLRLAPGQISPPWDRDNALRIDHGDLRLSYLKEKDVIEIAPSTLAWGKSKATISGTARPTRDANGALTAWDFDLKADEAVFAVEAHGLPPMKVDEWSLAGSFMPEEGRVTISRFIIRSGTAAITLAGDIVDAPTSPEIHLAGEVSPMPVDTLKRFWPKFLAGKARAWVLERIGGGEVLGGRFEVNLAAGQLEQIEEGGEVPPGAINVELNLADLNIAYIPDMPPVTTGEARLTVDGVQFSVDIPHGQIVLPSGQEIALTEGSFYIPDLRVDPQQGVISYKANGETTVVLELLDHKPLGYLQSVGMKPDFLGGTAEGGFTLSMPLLADLKFKDIKMTGLARLEGAVTQDLVPDMDIKGGGIDVNLSDESVEARGAITVNGAPAQFFWQRVFFAPDDRQPPLKVTATLDDAKRAQLGLKLNHLIKGLTPLTLSVTAFGQPSQTLNLQADLTQARLMFDSVGWTKPAGRAASLQFDVVKKEDGSTDLQNLTIIGDDIAVHGSLALDAQKRLKNFYFPHFSVSALTHMEIAAVIRADKVLDIKAEGPSFDGRQFFQSLFSAEQLAAGDSGGPSDWKGVDFTAEIGTVVGSYDTTIKNLHATMKKRDGRLVALDAKGELNGRSPAAVKLEHAGGARLIKAEAHDAGAAFRLVGFYPSVEGGEASLQVNLDAGARGGMSGTLWARDFAVVGDAVVENVLTDPNSTAMLGDRKQQTTGSRIAFTQLRAPFSVGGGKFRLQDSYINGPALGATIRGTADFKARTVDLGGTYVPLYGLNSAFRAIPILGPIIGGRQGEGLVGITFAIKGKLDDPTVLVNPMSVMTPGIFRQIFEFDAAPDAAAATSGSRGFAPR